MPNNDHQENLDDLIMGGDQVVVMRVTSPDGRQLDDDYREGASPMTTGGVNRGADDSQRAERPTFEVRGVDESSVDDMAAAPPMALTLIRPLAPDDPRNMAPTKLDAAVTAAKSDKITWGLKAIGANTTKMTGRGVVVAVLDTGIKRDHPSFADEALEIVERDYTGERLREGSGVAADEDGHGTHCAGTIFGRDVDGVRIGVAPGVTKVLVAKVIGGRAGTKQLLEAMDWAISEGANIISMSLGFDHVRYFQWLRKKNVVEQAAVSQTLNVHRDNVRMFDATMKKYESMALGLNQQTLVVAASGNEANRPAYTISKSSPAAAIGIVSVGAVNEASGDRYAIARFSNADPDLVGPGVAIVSAGIDDPLVAMSGTSMACPHIAGLAALHWESLTDGGLTQVTATMVKDELMHNARKRRAEVLVDWRQRDYGNGLPGVG